MMWGLSGLKKQTITLPDMQAYKNRSWEVVVIDIWFQAFLKSSKPDTVTTKLF